MLDLPPLLATGIALETARIYICSKLSYSLLINPLDRSLIKMNKDRFFTESTQKQELNNTLKVSQESSQTLLNSVANNDLDAVSKQLTSDPELAFTKHPHSPQQTLSREPEEVRKFFELQSFLAEQKNHASLAEFFSEDAEANMGRIEPTLL